MDGLFDRVKRLVNIKDYIELEARVDAKRAGSGSFRVNPCPFCGHNDCFTINEKDQFFKCFSCSAKGDVIEFEQQYRNMGSPLEAAKSIAGKRGIPVLDGEGSERGTRSREQEGPGPQPPPPAEVKEPGETKPEIDPSRGLEVRRIAAEYYHGRLMTSRAALSYQTDVRQHIREILERFKVGLGGGSLIGHCRGQGVTVAELMAVGLVRANKGGGFRSVVSAGVTVYPHFSGGEIQFFSLKDPKKKKLWQLKKECAPEGWLCYGQDALDQDEPVIIVEGENDRITVMDRGKYEHCIATIASYNEPAILERLKAIAKDRTWYLGFDNDPPPPGKPEGAGARYTRVYANALLSAGGDVRVIRIEPGKDGTKVDIDDILRAAEDPQAELVRLMDKAKKITKPVPDPAAKQALNQKNYQSLIHGFHSFKVLGEAEEGSLVFESFVHKKIYVVPLRDLNFDRMCQIAGPELPARVYHREKVPEGSSLISWRVFKTALIFEAGRCQLSTLQFCGQGIHTRKDGTLVIVVGGDAWQWDGKRFTIFDQPLIGDRIIQKNTGKKWIDFQLVIKRVSKMTVADAFRIREKVVGLVNQWKFTGPWDHYLVAGWLFAQMVQTFWSWRPHLWLTGPAGSGKTLLTVLFELLGGALSKRREGSNITEPALRQDIGVDASQSILDEIERSESRDKIINMARSAGRGGLVPIGGKDQKPSYFFVKHMIMFVSIETGIWQAPDRSRYLQIETHKDDARDPKIPNSLESETLRIEILSYVLFSVFKAKKLIESLGKIEGFEDRGVEAFAVALAMLAASDEKPLDSLTWGVNAALEDFKHRQEKSIPDDEVQIFYAILGCKIKVASQEDDPSSLSGGVRTIYASRSIAQLLEDDTERYLQDLQSNGLKPDKGGLFLVPSMVEQALLSKTRWKGVQTRGLLKRLPGAIEKQLRISGYKNPQWGVFIPEGIGNSEDTTTNVT